MNYEWYKKGSWMKLLKSLIGIELTSNSTDNLAFDASIHSQLIWNHYINIYSDTYYINIIGKLTNISYFKWFINLLLNGNIPLKILHFDTSEWLKLGSDGLLTVFTQLYPQLNPNFIAGIHFNELLIQKGIWQYMYKNISHLTLSFCDINIWNDIWNICLLIDKQSQLFIQTSMNHSNNKLNVNLKRNIKIFQRKTQNKQIKVINKSQKFQNIELNEQNLRIKSQYMQPDLQTIEIDSNKREIYETKTYINILLIIINIILIYNILNIFIFLIIFIIIILFGFIFPKISFINTNNISIFMNILRLFYIFLFKFINNNNLYNNLIILNNFNYKNNEFYYIILYISYFIESYFMFCFENIIRETIIQSYLLFNSINMCLLLINNNNNNNNNIQIIIEK